MSRLVPYLHRKLNRRACRRCRRAVAWALEPVPKVALIVTLIMFGGAMIYAVASIGDESASTRGLLMHLAVLDQRQRTSDLDNLKQRRLANAANLAQIRRTATINHRQALALGRVSLARAGDNARAIAAEATLTRENRRLILSVASQARQLATLQALERRATASTARQICTKVDTLTNGVLASLRESLAQLGKPGTAGALYYQAFPGELAKVRASLRASIKRFRSLRCIG